MEKLETTRGILSLCYKLEMNWSLSRMRNKPLGIRDNDLTALGDSLYQRKACEEIKAF